jgi:hypothetical protein
MPFILPHQTELALSLEPSKTLLPLFYHAILKGIMETKTVSHPKESLEALLLKAAAENRVTKASGNKLKPFERIELEGEGPTTTEIIAEGRR